LEKKMQNKTDFDPIWQSLRRWLTDNNMTAPDFFWWLRSNGCHLPGLNPKDYPPED